MNEKQLSLLAFGAPLSRVNLPTEGIVFPTENTVLFRGTLIEGYYRMLRTNGVPNQDSVITNEGSALAPYYAGDGVLVSIEISWSLCEPCARLSVYYLHPGTDNLITPLVDTSGNLSVDYSSKGKAIFSVPSGYFYFHSDAARCKLRVSCVGQAAPVLRLGKNCIVNRCSVRPFAELRVDALSSIVVPSATFAAKAIAVQQLIRDLSLPIPLAPLVPVTRVVPPPNYKILVQKGILGTPTFYRTDNDFVSVFDANLLSVNADGRRLTVAENNRVLTNANYGLHVIRRSVGITAEDEISKVTATNIDVKILLSLFFPDEQFRSFDVSFSHLAVQNVGTNKLQIQSYAEQKYPFSTSARFVDVGEIQPGDIFPSISIRSLADLTVYIRFQSGTPAIIEYAMEIEYLLL